MADDDVLNYGEFLADAMHSVVVRALNVAAEHGLPGEHHFYITFNTNHPDISMPDWLYDEYPHYMQIVLQYKFWDLQVDEHCFNVTLNFNKKPCTLIVPFDAILNFTDPSVNFSLQFQVDVMDDDDIDIEHDEVEDYLHGIDSKMLEKQDDINKHLPHNDAIARTSKKNSKKNTTKKHADITQDKDNIISINSLRDDS